jgi:hypothetical protein
VLCYVTATRRLTAFSTFQVVSGIEGLASWAGIIVPDFFEPLFVPNRLDSFKVSPELYSMRHCRLKLFQLIAGIVLAFTAKVDPAFDGTSKHSAILAIGQPFAGPAPIALALFFRIMPFCGKHFKPFVIFCGGDKPSARFAIKPTYCG